MMIFTINQSSLQSFVYKSRFKSKVLLTSKKTQQKKRSGFIYFQTKFFRYFMSLFSLIFSLLIAFLLFRIFFLHLRANSEKDPSFQKLPNPVKLAVLKETLLNQPTLKNLKRFYDFCNKEGISLPEQDYKEFIQEQVKLSNSPDALLLDNALFEKEAKWLDSVTPLEHFEASEALKKGDLQLYVEKKLITILRLYSDSEIQKNFHELIEKYPKAKNLLDEYNKLILLRENSLTDEESLKKLRSQRDSWERNIDLAIQEIIKLEPTPSETK